MERRSAEPGRAKAQCHRSGLLDASTARVTSLGSVAKLPSLATLSLGYTRIANLAFRLNYEDGRVLNEVVGPTRHRGHVEDWASHHPFLCRMNVTIKACLYRAMGCKGVRIEERYCRSDGQPRCGSVIAWD